LQLKKKGILPYSYYPAGCPPKGGQSKSDPIPSGTARAGIQIRQPPPGSNTEKHKKPTLAPNPAGPGVVLAPVYIVLVIGWCRFPLKIK